MVAFSEWLERLAKATMILAAFCAFGLAFLILVDVTARALSIKFYGVAEYVRNTIIVIVFLQAPYAIRIASMLRVDIFVNALPARSRAPLLAAGDVLGLIFFAGIAIGAVPPAIDAWVNNEFEGEGVVRVAAWPARFSIVYGCGLAAIFYVIRIIDRWQGRTPPVAPDAIQQH